MSAIYPPLVFLVGAAITALFWGRSRTAANCAYVGTAVVALINLFAFDMPGNIGIDMMGFQFELVRADKLAMLFTILFHIAALIVSIYSLHVKDVVQKTTGLLYAASAIGAVMAGDLITLFVWWELLAVTSVFQIWARKNKRSGGAGMRYLILHILSGLLLLAGAAWHYAETGSIAFGGMDDLGVFKLEGAAAWLIFLGFGVKCAFPFVHTWLVDAYPEATPTGAVYLCCFTTKVAVYCMARGYAGTGLLITIGGAMAMFPIFFAVIENDLRKVLGYSMINQIGFMMVGIGIGSEWGINGAVAHAFNDVLFKGLLFMSMGAVLYRTGRINGSDLGGLYKTMPWTTFFCIVGAASISAFPLFCGFVSKSMIMDAVAENGNWIIWLMLLFAAAGVFHHAGIKIPYFAFFGHDSGIRTKEAPLNMLIAMGISATLCIAIGCFPSLLYQLLPLDLNEFNAYGHGGTHVITQTQLLFFSALAFVTLMLFKIYPPELRATHLDVDWVYRKVWKGTYGFVDALFNSLNDKIHGLVVVNGLTGLGRFFANAPARLLGLVVQDRRGLDARLRSGTFPIGLTAFFGMLLFALLYFL